MDASGRLLDVRWTDQTSSGRPLDGQNVQGRPLDVLGRPLDVSSVSQVLRFRKRLTASTRTEHPRYDVRARQTEVAAQV